MSEAPAPNPVRLEPEDQARADFYALLARLFGAAPDAAQLQSIAAAQPLAPTEPIGGGDDLGAPLAGAWEELRSASGTADAEAVSDEYQTLFIGVGRSEVSLYASH